MLNLWLSRQELEIGRFRLFVLLPHRGGRKRLVLPDALEFAMNCVGFLASNVDFVAFVLKPNMH